MSKPINLMDVKQALRDKRFQESLPNPFKADLLKYMQKPGCACNMPFYKKIMLEAKEQLQAYYPNRTVANLDEEVSKLADNHFSVINCHINELETRLRKLAPGRKQIAVTRYEDQATVVINELDVIF